MNDIDFYLKSVNSSIIYSDNLDNNKYIISLVTKKDWCSN